MSGEEFLLSLLAGATWRVYDWLKKKFTKKK